eukprot:PhM_4_TR4111/c0_g1_i1/m.87454
MMAMPSCCRWDTRWATRPRSSFSMGSSSVSMADGTGLLTGGTGGAGTMATEFCVRGGATFSLSSCDCGAKAATGCGGETRFFGCGDGATSSCSSGGYSTSSCGRFSTASGGRGCVCEGVAMNVCGCAICGAPVSALVCMPFEIHDCTWQSFILRNSSSVMLSETVRSATSAPALGKKLRIETGTVCNRKTRSLVRDNLIERIVLYGIVRSGSFQSRTTRCCPKCTMAPPRSVVPHVILLAFTTHMCVAASERRHSTIDESILLLFAGIFSMSFEKRGPSTEEMEVSAEALDLYTRYITSRHCSCR